MTMKLPEGKCYLTTYVDREMMEELDKMRGEVPRNRVVRRAINDFLEANVKNLQGPKTTNLAAQAAVSPTPTSTNTRGVVHEAADKLIAMTTDDVAASGEEDVGVNEK